MGTIEHLEVLARGRGADVQPPTSPGSSPNTSRPSGAPRFAAAGRG